MYYNMFNIVCQVIFSFLSVEIVAGSTLAVTIDNNVEIIAGLALTVTIDDLIEITAGSTVAMTFSD